MTANDIKSKYLTRNFKERLEFLLPNYSDSFIPIEVMTKTVVKAILEEKIEGLSKDFFEKLDSLLRGLSNFLILENVSREEESLIKDVFLLASNFTKIEEIIVSDRTKKELEKIEILFDTRRTLSFLNSNSQSILKKIEVLLQNDSFNSKISGMYKSYLDDFFEEYREKDPTGSYNTDRSDIQPKRIENED